LTLPPDVRHAARPCSSFIFGSEACAGTTPCILEDLDLLACRTALLASAPSTPLNRLARTLPSVIGAEDPRVRVFGATLSALPGLNCGTVHRGDRLALLNTGVEVTGIGHEHESFLFPGVPEAWGDVDFTSFMVKDHFHVASVDDGARLTDSLRRQPCPFLWLEDHGVPFVHERVTGSQVLADLETAHSVYVAFIRRISLGFPIRVHY